MPRQSGEMLSLELATRVMDELALLGTFNLVLSGGEILTHPDLLRIMAHARRGRFALSLITNGTLLTPEKADRIAALHPLSVAVSIYSTDPGVHDRMTNVPGSLRKSLAAVELLRERGVPIALNCVVARDNAAGDQFAGVGELARELGADLALDVIVAPPRSACAAASAVAPEACHLPSVLSSPWVPQEPAPLWLADGTKVGSDRRREAILCTAGFLTLTVTARGDVLPCPAFPRRVGNVVEEPLADVWRDSPELGALRAWRRGDVEDCRGCELIDHCRYCPGVALAESGRVLAASPSACLQARVRRDLARKSKAEALPPAGPPADSGPRHTRRLDGA